jgi:hypothetical protein
MAENRPKNLDDIRAIVADVVYRDWAFFTVPSGPGFTLQVRFETDINFEGAPPASGLHHCRKWYLSAWATRSEIVQTALKAVFAAEEHEARERFTYRGRAVFGPHFNVDRLHELADSGEGLDVREPNKSLEESAS